ncbi:MAG: MarR family transcriptional regulator [Clostridia bacterium]|nr:MarR family transcriptional regulator [Clostridia bacterium]
MKNEKDYLRRIFLLSKKVEEIMQTDKSTPFNTTELRLMKELLIARLEGTRLISTQIAKRLGVTRSSVSQMVNKLEAQGIVRRQADEVDRKIAYILMTEEAEQMCKAELSKWNMGVEKIVTKFGEEKMEQLLVMMDEFADVAKSIKDIGK